MIRYNNTLNAVEGYINGAWASFSAGGSGVSVNLGTATTARTRHARAD